MHHGLPSSAATRLRTFKNFQLKIDDSLAHNGISRLLENKSLVCAQRHIHTHVNIFTNCSTNYIKYLLPILSYNRLRRPLLVLFQYLWFSTVVTSVLTT